MTLGEEVFRRIQSAARSMAAQGGTGAPTQEYLIRHTLESFLDRLSRTAHGEDFVFKGGILLAAYGVRRPTKDADANAVRADVTVDHLVDECEADLDQQMALVASCLDPVFSRRDAPPPSRT